jgi:hypothetical protein
MLQDASNVACCITSWVIVVNKSLEGKMNGAYNHLWHYVCCGKCRLNICSSTQGGAAASVFCILLFISYFRKLCLQFGLFHRFSIL